MRTLNSKEMLDDLYKYNTEEVICRWNLKRICYVIALVILLEVINLFDSGVQNTPYLLVTSLSLVIIGVFLLLVSMWVSSNLDKVPLSVGHKIYLNFWIFIPTLVAFTFFIRDAEMGRPPLNLLIIIGLISMVPILAAKETVMTFTLPFIANALISIYVRPNITYLLYSIVFCLAGILITAVVHKQYITLIQELNRLMTHDPLTKLLNRQAGQSKAEFLLGICRRQKKPCAVMMIDIDNFKAYNDKKSHAYGDEVLIKTADAIQRTFVRESDVVYRYGGEEFCVCIAADTGLDDMVVQLMDNIKRLNIPAEITTASDLLTVSIGIAVSQRDDETFENLLKQADWQLYVSKSNGKNQASKILVCL